MIGWEQLHAWQRDWRAVRPEAIRVRQEFLRRAPSRDSALFIQALLQVRAGRRELIKDYAAPFLHQLSLDSSVASTPHLDRLLTLALKHHPDGVPDPRRWFEGVSLYDQALAVARIEFKDPFESVGRDLEWLIDFLSDKAFKDDYQRIALHAYHDPNNAYIVTKQNIAIDATLVRPGLIPKVYSFDCRRIKNGGIAFMDDRIKSAFSVWLKIGRKMQEGEVTPTYNVTDRRGLLFVLPTMRNVQTFSQLLLKKLVKDGAKVLEELTVASAGKPVDPTNKHSSHLFCAAKMLVEWGAEGQEYEIQFMTFHDYLTSKRSLTDANHELYKQRQAFEYAFPHLWPKDIYGIDWADPVVRQELRGWKMDQLGWHVNEKFAV